MIRTTQPSGYGTDILYRYQENGRMCGPKMSSVRKRAGTLRNKFKIRHVIDLSDSIGLIGAGAKGTV